MLLIVLLLGGRVWAVGPSEMFLDAWQLREDGMKAEKAGEFKTAYDRYRSAAKIYDQIAREHPDWKPAMVEFRRNGMKEQINGVAEKAAKQDLGRAATDTRPLPPGNALPAAAGRQPAGGAVVARPPAAGAGVDDPFARLRIQELERQQAGARQTLEALARERDALKSRLTEVENARNFANYEARKNREERDKARAELAELQEKGINSGVAGRARMAELEKKVAEMDERIAAAAEAGRKEGRDEATAENERLRGRLAGIEAELAAARRDSASFEETIRVLTVERDRWKAERDQLAAMVQQGTNDPTLLATNQRLEKELAETREKLVALNTEKEKDTRQIAELKTRLQQVEGELGAARKENAEYRDRMSLLEKQLNEAKAALESAPATVDPLLAEENRTLRDIVVRQLRQQVYRARARNLLLSELAKLEINSKALIRYIDQLEGKGSEPTPEQVARIQDHEIRALAGVELSGKFFSGDEAAVPSDAEETPGADGTGSPEDSGTSGEVASSPGSVPPEVVAGRPDAVAAFDAQKRGLATSAESAFRSGNFAEAEETYRLIVEADPSDVRMMCNLGVSLLKQEKFGEAIPRFQEALARDEANPFAHLMLGVCHWKLRQPELAIDRLNRSLVLQPSNPQAWLYLGLVALDASRWQDARIAFAKAVEIKPDYALAHYNLAVVHTKPGMADPVQAKRSYEESLRLGGARDEAIELFLRVGPEPTPLLPDEFDPEALPGLDDPISPPPPGPELPPGAEDEELPRL